jgi:hypothetical protein
MQIQLIYIAGNSDDTKGGHDINTDNESKVVNPSVSGREEESLADESTTVGDMDGGGGLGIGLTGGDENAESGDKGPTPDKTVGA